MFLQSLLLLLIAFIFGVEHSLEADHVVAVSTLTSRTTSAKKSVLLASMWGLGHSVTLLVLVSVLLVTRVVIPERLSLFLEMLVGFLLVFLGTRVFYQKSAVRLLALAMRYKASACCGILVISDGFKVKLARVKSAFHSLNSKDRGGASPHAVPVERRPNPTARHSALTAEAPEFIHGEYVHQRFKDGWHLLRHAHDHDHPHEHSHDHTHQHSFLVGMVHGLAGSSALVLLVSVTLNSFLLSFLFILFFGLGSIVGMALISLLINVPFKLTQNYRQVQLGLQMLAGGFSVFMGVVIVFQVGFVDGLIGKF